jgi:hypothetical protein
MFTEEFVPLHVQKVGLKTEERKPDERFPVFGVGLVLEPLTSSLAKQLGPEVLAHCFTDKGAIREQMTEVTVELTQPEQCLIVRMAEDVAEHCRLRHVRVRRIKITKRDSSTDGGGARKSKKVGPQTATLRATFDCLIDSAEKVHQQFLCDFFAKTMYFTFEPEQENLFTGVFTDDDDDDTPQPGLRLAGPPTPDPDAGDVLDEQPAKRKRGRPKKGGAQ